MKTTIATLAALACVSAAQAADNPSAPLLQVGEWGVGIIQAPNAETLCALRNYDQVTTVVMLTTNKAPGVSIGVHIDEREARPHAKVSFWFPDGQEYDYPVRAIADGYLVSQQFGSRMIRFPEFVHEFTMQPSMIVQLDNDVGHTIDLAGSTATFNAFGDCVQTTGVADLPVPLNRPALPPALPAVPPAAPPAAPQGPARYGAPLHSL
jgi:hypothetical protein